MKLYRSSALRPDAMSLIEVTIAVGIVAFCLVAIVGLIPVMLNVVTAAREKTLTSRIYQSVALDLRESLPEAGETRLYEWDTEGFLLRVSTNSGALGSDSRRRYVANVSSRDGFVPAGAPAGCLILSEVLVINEARKTTNLNRPLWTLARGIQN